MTPPGKLAKKLAATIREDLEGRKGIYDDVEPDIQMDIEEGHAEVIQEVIDKWVEGMKL